MRPWARLMYVISGIAMAVVGVSSIVAAVRRGSWEPIVAVGWLPAVVVATWWPGTRRQCLRRRQSSPG